jgi:hypothetical protein
MDRTTLLNRLAEAMDKVREGARLVAQQKLLVLDLEHKGLDASDAKLALDALEDQQLQNVIQRDAIYKALMDS